MIRVLGLGGPVPTDLINQLRPKVADNTVLTSMLLPRVPADVVDIARIVSASLVFFPGVLPVDIRPALEGGIRFITLDENQEVVEIERVYIPSRDLTRAVVKTKPFEL